MSALAQEHGAVNLCQGCPDFDCDPKRFNLMNHAMRAGLNQYPLMAGLPDLREAIAAKVESLYGRAYDVANEITVTAGATQAIQTVLAVTQMRLLFSSRFTIVMIRLFASMAAFQSMRGCAIRTTGPTGTRCAP
jgi:aspartate/methionine/tyrosine aminotransferase